MLELADRTSHHHYKYVQRIKDNYTEIVEKYANGQLIRNPYKETKII